MAFRINGVIVDNPRLGPAGRPLPFTDTPKQRLAVISRGNVVNVILREANATPPANEVPSDRAHIGDAASGGTITRGKPTAPGQAKKANLIREIRRAGKANQFRTALAAASVEIREDWDAATDVPSRGALGTFLKTFLTDDEFVNVFKGADR